MGEGHGGGDGKRKRRCQGAMQVTDNDPAVLRELPKVPGYAAKVVDDIKNFVEGIMLFPNMVRICRLKKGILKKALAVWP